jgi:hypothetical protein
VLGRGAVLPPFDKVHNREWMIAIESWGKLCDALIRIAIVYRRIYTCISRTRSCSLLIWSYLGCCLETLIWAVLIVYPQIYSRHCSRPRFHPRRCCYRRQSPTNYLRDSSDTFGIKEIVLTLAPSPFCIGSPPRKSRRARA